MQHSVERLEKIANAPKEEFFKDQDTKDEDAGIISANLSENSQQMAGFRKLLVHRYWKVDYGTVYQIIRNNLNVLRRFAGIAAGLV